jgi:LysR family transcriptional activator of nhaA
MNINYKHLNYFRVVARSGSITQASRILHITPQTISGQISLLEDSIGAKLFEKQGRHLVLTNKGKVVFKYADQLFSIGEELGEYLRSGGLLDQGELNVGVMDGIPKIIAYKILAPVMDNANISLVCHEGSFDQLISRLAIRELDIILSDMPVNSAYSIKAYNHKLGESPMTCFATPTLARTLGSKFPDCLNHKPLLLPTRNSTIRPALDQWFMMEEIAPNIVGEFDDSALLKAFGETGAGAFFMPSIIEKEVCRHYGVKIIGRTSDVREQFYLLSLERQVDKGHPMLSVITQNAINTVFSTSKRHSSTPRKSGNMVG